jgi:stringent starvation protein B
MPNRAHEKCERLAAILERGLAMVHLDARCAGVRVPEYLGKESHLRLNLSYRFDPPDLDLSVWGVKATLRFGGRRFAVEIPWQAVFAIASHATQQFWTFPEDMPPELLQRVSETPSPVPAVRPTLRDVSSEPVAGEGEPPAAPARRHLRLVK